MESPVLFDENTSIESATARSAAGALNGDLGAGCARRQLDRARHQTAPRRSCRYPVFPPVP